MKRIKKFITVLITVIIATTCIVFTGCEFTFKLDGCDGWFEETERIPEEPDKDNETLASEFTLELEQLENTFYLPRVSGYIVRKSVPSKISAVCEHAETTLTIKALTYENGQYIMTFDQNINAKSGFNKGETVEVAILIYDEEVTTLEEKASFVANDNYEVICGINYSELLESSNERFCYLDKSSNWTKPM